MFVESLGFVYRKDVDVLDMLKNEASITNSSTSHATQEPLAAIVLVQSQRNTGSKLLVSHAVSCC